MRTKTFLAMAALLASGSAMAASDTKTLTGAQCVPQTTSKWSQMRVGATGLTNQSAELPLAVVCALPGDGTFYQGGSLHVYMRAGASTGQAYCKPKGSGLTTTPETRYLALAANGTGVIKWEGTINVAHSHLYLDCYLPAGFRIGLIKLIEQGNTSE